jgi:hypothetical protein
MTYEILERIDYDDEILRLHLLGKPRGEIATEINKAPNYVSKRLQKIKQFSGDGVTDLIIVDLRLLTNGRSWKEVALGEFVEFMEERIP